LIAQSLICLRTGLEALNVPGVLNTHGFTSSKGTNKHRYCDIRGCKLYPNSNFSSHLQRYSDLLSDVFFVKENMRHKHWWLSVFYSLCIQNFVRWILLRLTEFYGDDFQSRAANYLNLAVRLFCASSGEDILSQEQAEDIIPIFSPAGILETKIAIARYAVQHSTWKERDIQGSAHYLKSLFDIKDTGEKGVLSDLFVQLDSKSRRRQGMKRGAYSSRRDSYAPSISSMSSRSSNLSSSSLRHEWKP
jgi:hypothetical protein